MRFSDLCYLWSALRLGGVRDARKAAWVLRETRRHGERGMTLREYLAFRRKRRRHTSRRRSTLQARRR